MKKQGFTLAEVLITLAIIGVCAAMLITTIKNINPNEKSNIAMARKAVGNFTEATRQVLLFNSKTRKMDNLTGCDDAACVIDLYGKYLQVTKSSTQNPTGLGGSCKNVGELIDGLMFCVEYDKKCALHENETVQILPPDEGVVSAIVVSGACAVIHYDVNGVKPPNMTGKDRFMIPVRKNGVKMGAAATKIKTENNDGDELIFDNDDDGPGGLF